jgi:hypothetical protein
MKKIYLQIFLVLSLAGCSSSPRATDQPIVMNENGPNVLNARAEPELVQLNRDLQPEEPGEIVADVKDFKNPVTSVQLKFQNVPVQVPMENIGGTTWKGELTPSQLHMLAVQGQTVVYKANVIATDAAGLSAQNSQALDLLVSTPKTG